MTKPPSPTWRKLGLMVVFLLVIMASSAIPALADENFGIGADVEIEVEKAMQQQIAIGTDPYLPLYIIMSFMLGIIITLLFVRFKMRRVTATTGALHGGEKLG